MEKANFNVSVMMMLVLIVMMVMMSKVGNSGGIVHGHSTRGYLSTPFKNTFCVNKLFMLPETPGVDNFSR